MSTLYFVDPCHQAAENSKRFSQREVLISASRRSLIPVKLLVAQSLLLEVLGFGERHTSVVDFFVHAIASIIKKGVCGDVQAVCCSL